jgi:hypothetical protein
MPTKQSCWASAAVATFFAVFAVMGPVHSAHAADPVVFSFASVGDSRQDPIAPDPTTLLPSLSGTLLPQDAQWLQNTKAFSRILRSITTEKPNLLFFNGDMVYGYERPILPTATATGAPLWSGTNPMAWEGQSTAATVSPDFVTMYVQYGYWRGMVANLFETGTYVVPVPGNHETQCSYKKYPYNVNHNPNCSTAGATAYAENEAAYVANVGDLITDLVTNERFTAVSGATPLNVTGLTQGTAPKASTNNGNITSNQAELSYSFDVQTSGGLLHFAVVNTDPAGADGTAPADWLSGDLAAAKARGAAKYFVFGHKPAWTYQYGGHGAVGAAGLDATSIPLRNAFWAVIAQYNATYFCGHEHVINVAPWADPTGVSANTPYQVIVGTGGSPFDDTLTGTCPSCTEPSPLANPSDRYYGWALVQVHASGAVTLSVNGFNDAYGPTQSLTYYNQSL